MLGRMCRRMAHACAGRLCLAGSAATWRYLSGLDLADLRPRWMYNDIDIFFAVRPGTAEDDRVWSRLLACAHAYLMEASGGWHGACREQTARHEVRIQVESNGSFCEQRVDPMEYIGEVARAIASSLADVLRRCDASEARHAPGYAERPRTYLRVPSFTCSEVSTPHVRILAARAHAPPPTALVASAPVPSPSAFDTVPAAGTRSCGAAR